MPLRIAILVSGRGSNMSSIFDAIENGRLNAEVQLVFSNNPEALALKTASSRGFKTAAISHKGMTRQEHEQRLLKLLSNTEIDFLVLAGYMRVLSPEFLSQFKHEDGFYRVINIHPSLLPSFPGAHAYEDAFNYGVRLSGITVHLVDEKIDHGPILAQASFERLENDDLESFRARGLALEHKIFPQVLQEIASKGLSFFRRDERDSSTGRSAASNIMSTVPEPVLASQTVDAASEKDLHGSLAVYGEEKEKNR